MVAWCVMDEVMDWIGLKEFEGKYLMAFGYRLWIAITFLFSGLLLTNGEMANMVHGLII